MKVASKGFCTAAKKISRMCVCLLITVVKLDLGSLSHFTEESFGGAGMMDGHVKKL